MVFRIQLEMNVGTQSSDGKENEDMTHVDVRGTPKIKACISKQRPGDGVVSMWTTEQLKRKQTMVKKVIMAGLLGWVALAVWIFIVNGVFGFKSRIDMKQIDNERQVYTMLQNSIVEPGRYACNPELIASRFPDNMPVYSIQYSGFGHESAGRDSLIKMVSALLASLIATWILSMADERVISSYIRRVLSFTVIGLFLAFAGEMTKFGIGSYPLKTTLILAVHAIIQWTFVGLFVAWRMKPHLLKEL